MDDVTARQALSNAMRYWEPRRILFNVVMAVVAGAVYATNLPHSAHALTFDAAQVLFVLAVLANIAYCAAYLADVLAQLSTFRKTWLRFCWVLLTVGLAFAAILTNFFSHGLFAAI